LARDGGTRWCEFATAPPPVAQTFLRLYPQTSFLIVHRRADAFLCAVLESSRWGLAGTEFVPFVSAYPASSVAALVAYWVTRTAALVDFEQAHQQSCLRVRMEDLSANAAQVLRDIRDFIALDDEPALPQSLPDPRSLEQIGDPPPPVTANIPFAQIPPPLLAQLNELHHKLGYPPIAPAEA
jgi:hypothetical protein